MHDHSNHAGPGGDPDARGPGVSFHIEPHALRVIAVARAEWLRGVREWPGLGSDRLTVYVSKSMAGVRGQVYDTPNEAPWCGHFAAFCLASVGFRSDFLLGVRVASDPKTTASFGSTYRLSLLAHIDTARLVTKAADVRAGDVVSVGYDGQSAWGSHIVIAAGAYEGDVLQTFEGNAVGRLGGGSWGEGVISGTRPSVRARTHKGFCFAFRPLAADFTEKAA